MCINIRSVESEWREFTEWRHSTVRVEILGYQSGDRVQSGDTIHSECRQCNFRVETTVRVEVLHGVEIVYRVGDNRDERHCTGWGRYTE
jgi:hypothetical protein